QAFNPACFRKNELTALSTVMERFMNLSTTEMIDFSHKEKAWLDNIDKRQLIDYFFAFDLN
ncbi:MAG: DNA-binding protein, partial [Bacteroidota bacterium]|nr:DNA-binding protein [Bacteroidota bacterium]